MAVQTGSNSAAAVATQEIHTDTTVKWFLLGAVGFVGQIPVFLLAPVGGIVADRYSRRNIVVATQTASMLLVYKDE